VATQPVRKGVPGVGTRIRAARRARGWTIDRLAREAGVDDSSVTQWELGVRDLYVRHLVTLAAALGCPVADLLPESPLPPPAVLVTTMTPSSRRPQ
jgi:transcriptional regulator with XRE-family HTH domain